MKLITLNIWGGQILEPLKKFISENKDTDVFCFQEVFNGRKNPVTFQDAVPNVYSIIENLLPRHKGFFKRQENMGLSIFVKNTINIEEEGDFFIYRFQDAMIDNDPSTQGRNLQFIKFKLNGKDIIVSHMHGLWIREGKGDTPERLEQSKKVKEFLDKQKGAKILAGDFNLLPDTKSLLILEENLRNLVKEYKVTSTRTKLYDRYDMGDLFADYILVSNGVKVLDFKVLPDVVSDHSPLMLEFTSL